MKVRYISRTTLRIYDIKSAHNAGTKKIKATDLGKSMDIFAYATNHGIYAYSNTLDKYQQIIKGDCDFAYLFPTANITETVNGTSTIYITTSSILVYHVAGSNDYSQIEYTYNDLGELTLLGSSSTFMSGIIDPDNGMHQVYSHNVYNGVIYSDADGGYHILKHTDATTINQSIINLSNYIENDDSVLDIQTTANYTFSINIITTQGRVYYSNNELLSNGSVIKRYTMYSITSSMYIDSNYSTNNDYREQHTMNTSSQPFDFKYQTAIDATYYYANDTDLIVNYGENYNDSVYGNYTIFSSNSDKSDNKFVRYLGWHDDGSRFTKDDLSESALNGVKITAIQRSYFDDKTGHDPHSTYYGKAPIAMGTNKGLYLIFISTPSSENDGADSNWNNTRFKVGSGTIYTRIDQSESLSSIRNSRCDAFKFTDKTTQVPIRKWFDIVLLSDSCSVSKIESVSWTSVVYIDSNDKRHILTIDNEWHCTDTIVRSFNGARVVGNFMLYATDLYEKRSNEYGAIKYVSEFQGNVYADNVMKNAQDIVAINNKLDQLANLLKYTFT